MTDLFDFLLGKFDSSYTALKVKKLFCGGFCLCAFDLVFLKQLGYNELCGGVCKLSALFNARCAVERYPHIVCKLLGGLCGKLALADKLINDAVHIALAEHL